MIRRENGRANQKTDQTAEPKLLVKIYGPSCKQRFWQTGPAHVPYFVQTHPYPNNHTDTHTQREHKDQHSYTLEKKDARVLYRKRSNSFAFSPFIRPIRGREKEQERQRGRKKDRKPCVHLLLVRFVPFKTKTKGQPSAPAHNLLLSTVESMWTKKGCVLRYGQIYVSKLYKNMNQLNVNSIGVCGKHDRPN